MTTDELRHAMNSVWDRFEAGEITQPERNALYLPLNDRYHALTGQYYTTGRSVLDPVHTTVNHNRARTHGRVR